MAPRAQPLAERFWAKVDKAAPNGCWNWTAYVSQGGYGYISLPSRKLCRAHRLSYEMHKGPIPSGLQIDHLCRNRRCVNPAHLEAVTARVNVGNARRRKVFAECPRCGFSELFPNNHKKG